MASEAPPQIVFLVGAPRSGTTWLQRLLGSAAAVATPQETQLFDGYVRSWYELWGRQLPDDRDAWRAARHRGLPAVLTEEQFDAVVAELVDRIYGAVAARKPGSTVVLDKNPDNALHVELLLRVCPEAKILHIVRDGRDVASSLLSARRGWGNSWAPRSAHAAGQAWARYVTAARGASGRAPYLETRYESLHADGAGELRRCLDFCGVTVDDGEIQRTLDAESFAKRKEQHESQQAPPDPLLWGGEVVKRLGGAPAEPQGFFGEGASGSWASTWSAYDRWSFDQAAGGVLTDVGYARDPALAQLSAAQRAAFSVRLEAWQRSRTAYRKASSSLPRSEQ